MLECCQDPPLVLEAPHHTRTVKGRIDQLHCDVFFKLLIGATSEIYSAHTAAADDVNQAVRTGMPSIEIPGFCFDRGPLARIRDRIQEIPRLLIRPDQGPNLGAERRAGAAPGAAV